MELDNYIHNIIYINTGVGFSLPSSQRPDATRSSQDNSESPLSPIVALCVTVPTRTV